MVKEEDSMKVEGEIIAGPQKVKIRGVGGGAEGNTIPQGLLDSLRVKIKKHRFLVLNVVLDQETGKRLLIGETTEE